MENASVHQAVDDQADIRALEERAFNAWPALQTVLADGWVFRFADGYTKRANSANALAPTRPFAATLALAETLYARLGLPVIFRLSPLAGAAADADLERAGFHTVDETLVMTARVPEYPATHSDIVIASAPDEAWSRGFADANAVPAEKRLTHDRMLAAIRMPAAFATLIEDGRAAAYGIAVAERGMVGLFDVVTAPSARRRGLGGKLVAALLEWGRRQGAREAYLQVVATNLPARALYAKFGFEERYRYHYRVRS